MTRRTGAIGAIVGAVAVALVLGGCAAGGGGDDASGPQPDEKGIAYRQVDGQDLALDACLPDGDDPRPAVVLVHGGAFQEGDRGNMASACRALADAGFAAFAADYRLLPSTYPAQVEDVAAAVQWIREPAQAERFALDGTVSLLGSSAGAIIALNTAASLAAEGAPVHAVVGLSAAGDLTPAGADLGAPRPELEKVVLGYLGCDAIEDCAASTPASPVTFAAQLPPTLLVHGSDDLIPVEQARALAGALGAAGVRNELVVVDGKRHGLQLLNDRTRTQIAEFLANPG